MDETQMSSVSYTSRDGRALQADLYRPLAPGPHPMLIAVHGGAWQSGAPGSMRAWGEALAADGIAVCAVPYRLATAQDPGFPGALDDVNAALAALRERAHALAIDPARLGLLGQSAGGHLAALAGLRDPAIGAPPLKAVAAVYGIFDLAAYWNHELVTRPGDSSVARFLGTELVEDRHVYFHASPLSHVTRKTAGPDFFLAYGLEDPVVPHDTQSEPFLRALAQAGHYARSFALPGAGHFWMNEPFDIPASASAALYPRLLKFLRERL